MLSMVNRTSVIINKSKLRVALSLITIVFYCYTRMSFGENISFRVYFVLGMLSVAVFWIFSFSRKITVSSMDLFAFLIIFVMFIWNNWDLQYGAYTSAFNFTILFMTFMIASKDDKWMDFVFKISIFFGIFYAFWTIASWISPNVYYSFVLPLVEKASIYDLAKQYEQGYMPGMTSHYSTNGLYLSSGITFTLGYYFFDGRKLTDVSKKGWAIFMFQLFALLLTGKRGPIIYIVVAFIVTYITYNADKPITRYIRVIGIGFAVVIAFFVASTVVPALGNFVLRFQEAIASGDVSVRRFSLWGQGWAQFLKHPVLGNGWYWFRYHNLYGQVTYHVHNCYIQWLCELGVVGAIPFFAFTIISYIRALKILRKVRKHKLDIGTDLMKYISIPLLYETFFVCISFAGTAFYEAQSLCPYIFCCAYIEYVWKRYKSVLR